MKTKIRRALWLRFDRTLSHDPLRQAIILMGCLLVAFILSHILLLCFGGDWQEYCRINKINEWIFPLYLLIDGNAFSNFYNDDFTGKGAVFVVSLIYVVGVIIFTGMIISVMTNMIERRVEDYKEGHIHYLKSGHYIILGYDEMVPSFITYIFDKDDDAYILILSSTESIEINEKLRRSFGEEKMKRIIVNYGHKTTSEAYENIHLEAAEHVYIVGDHHKPAHDAINVECVDSICRYLCNPKRTQRPSGITCAFKDLDTYAAFKTSDIFKNLTDLGIEFTPYNFYAGWAKQVFVKREYKEFDNPDAQPNKYPSVYGVGITPDDEKKVHLVFVGTTNFAVAFAMEAAHVLHFPNFHSKGVKTLITFIDKNADKEKNEFIIRNRHFFEIQSYIYRDISDEPKEISKDTGREFLYFKDHDNSDFLDVEFEFIKGDVFSKNVQEEIAKWAQDFNGQYLSIFLAMADQRQNFVLGMNMPDAIYDNAIPVFIRQDRSDNFVTNLRKTDDKDDKHKLCYAKVEDSGLLKIKKREARYANIYPFGMNETAYSADNRSLKRAKLINYLYATANYDTYKFQGILALDSIPESNIWEEANEKWHKLSVALKWSNLYNSYTIRTKSACLRAMRGLDIDDKSHDYDTLSEYEVKIMAVVEHNRWNVEKLLMGYRKPHKDEDKYEYAEFADKLEKNKKLYIHHDIRPFDQLSSIKELDREFSRYIPWILKMTEGK